MRCYPSTIVKASLGGFLGGGSGGIGSVAHGGLRDFQTVRAIEVVTMEPEPRVMLHEGEAVHEILHAWGTNGSDHPHLACADSGRRMVAVHRGV